MFDVMGVSDEGLVDAIQAWDRVVSWAQAGQLAAIGELARRRPAQPGQPGTESGISEFAVDEIAAALRLSRPAAGTRLHIAVELTGRLPATAAALRHGNIDYPKARAVVDAITPLDDRTTTDVETRVLPRASHQTVGQLRASLARAVLAADPTGAEDRHTRAATDRRVTLTPLPDGMAELWALLPADTATTAYTTLDRCARTGPADHRSMDARRADALIHLITHATTADTSSPSGASSGWTGHSGGTDNGDSSRGTDDSRRTASRGSTDTGSSSGTAACTGRSAASAGTGRSSGSGGGNGSGSNGSGGNGGNGSGSNGSGGNGGSGSCGTCGSGRVGRVGSGPLVHVTVPADTLLGLGDDPGELSGYGPIPASMARRIAADPSGTWRRIVTDPATGTVLDVGRTTYRPPAPLTRHVAARDGTCRFPGCRQPAHRCDIDHLRPYPTGPTAATNLATLCRHHHRLKHRTRWQVTHTGDGDLTWTAPTGHQYTTQPQTLTPAMTSNTPHRTNRRRPPTPGHHAHPRAPGVDAHRPALVRQRS